MKTFLVYLGAAGFLAVKEEKKARIQALEAARAAVEGLERKAGPALVEAVGYRPMELLLVSLSACSFVDLLSILAKQRFRVYSAYATATGARAKTIPSRFTSLQIGFKVGFSLDRQDSAKTEEKYLKKAQVALEKAAALSVMKYCSVSASLDPGIKLTTSCQASLTTPASL